MVVQGEGGWGQSRHFLTGREKPQFQQNFTQSGACLLQRAYHSQRLCPEQLDASVVIFSTRYILIYQRGQTGLVAKVFCAELPKVSSRASDTQ